MSNIHIYFDFEEMCCVPGGAALLATGQAGIRRSGDGYEVESIILAPKWGKVGVPVALEQSESAFQIIEAALRREHNVDIWHAIRDEEEERVGDAKYPRWAAE